MGKLPLLTLVEHGGSLGVGRGCAALREAFNPITPDKCSHPLPRSPTIYIPGQTGKYLSVETITAFVTAI